MNLPFPSPPPFPGGNVSPFPAAPSPFPGQQQPVQQVIEPEGDTDPISVFFGKSAESFIDTATFGIFQPDIVPDWAERNSPLAATLGGITGTIAGFAPSFGASSIAAKALLGSFRYTRRLQEAAKLTAGIVGAIKSTQPFITPIIQGGLETGLTFAIHDAAREIVNQTKTGNPDIYELAKKSVAGGVGGMFLGTVGTYTNYMGPVTQALSMGTTMTMAEVITDIAAGEDVKSMDYIKERLPVTFFTGAAIGLWNARGWKGRMEGMNAKVIDKYWVEIERDGFTNKAGEINVNPKGIMEVLKSMGVESTDIWKGAKPEEIAAFKKLAEWDWQPAKLGVKGQERSIQGRIHGLAKTLGIMDKSGAPTDAYKAILKEATGMETTKGMSKEQLESAFYELSTPMRNMVPGVFKERTEPGITANIIGAPERVNLWNGFKDLTESLETAGTLAKFEQKNVENVIRAYEAKFRQLFKEDADKIAFPAPKMGEKVRAFAMNEPGFEKTIISDVIEGTVDRATLTPRINKLIDEYKKITDIYWHRTNSTKQRVGEPEIPYREFYMRNLMDKPALIKQGYTRAELTTAEQSMYPGRQMRGEFNPTLEHRAWIKPGEEGIPHIKDPFLALRNMVRNDLKTIYLTEPGRIFKQQVKELVEVGALDAGKEKYLKKFYNEVMFGQKSDKTAAISRNWVNFLSDNPGRFFDEYAAKINRDLGDNPMQVINHFLGVTVTHAFLGFRPKLALRNATQFLFQHGFISTKNMARGMNPFDSPKLFEKLRNESMYRKAAAEGTEEEMGRVAGSFGKAFDGAAFHQFQQSNMGSIDVSMKQSFFEAMDYITKAKFRKLGWADKEGIKLREEARLNGNKDWNQIVSARELNLLKQEVDHTANTSNFLYNFLGMPMITKSDVAAPFTKLMSFPMNYIYKYLGELTYRMVNGTPMWAKDMGVAAPKIPTMQRLGLVKHFVGLSMLAAGMEAAFGIDFSSVVGMSYNPNKNEKGERKGFELGIFDIRPNPVTSAFLTMKDVWSQDPYISAMAKSRIKNMSFLPIPEIAAVRDINKLADTENLKGYIFYEPRKSRGRAKPKTFVPFPNVGGGGTFNVFE